MDYFFGLIAAIGVTTLLVALVTSIDEYESHDWAEGNNERS